MRPKAKRTVSEPCSDAGGDGGGVVGHQGSGGAADADMRGHERVVGVGGRAEQRQGQRHAMAVQGGRPAQLMQNRGQRNGQVHEQHRPVQDVAEQVLQRRRQGAVCVLGDRAGHMERCRL